MRSRAVSLPLACWRATDCSEPAWSASSLRLASSARRSAMGGSDIGAQATEVRRMVTSRDADWSSVPVEPPPSVWALPDLDAVARAGEGDVVAVGADLEPGTLLAAYRNGMFPMPGAAEGRMSRRIVWWSPDPRGILPLDGLRVSLSLRKSCRRF